MAERLLTIDTSTPCCSIALSEEDRLLGEILINASGHHTLQLMASLADLLNRLGLAIADVDLFAAVIGPGSFTGLRVGLATVKGLALARQRPVVGVSSLQTLAMHLPFCRVPVWSIVDARKNEVYAGTFDCRQGYPEPLAAETVMAPEQLLASISGEAIFIGSGAVAYRPLIEKVMGERACFPPPPANLPRASSAALLARQEFRAGRSVAPDRLCPVYIRPSEAEIAWAAKRLPG
ncbi:MAG: tRNA (adenosine(37)-N6)-threonylcarbamoyltransferase complex dimerization subunit type 1 TsaB [Desulfuromonadaceae bacterium]|nr:tRNA (adenosine(37)-N6)-threonylcarbamoyltransferase complex dimerization subunit type 1 TsaB [Desulfuromonadaceae bacterium]